MEHFENNSMYTLKRRKRELHNCAHRGVRRGGAAVELAIMAPILAFFLLGAIDMGQFVNGEQVVSNASREGARVAARNDTLNVSEVESSVMGYLANSLPGVNPATLDATVQVNVTDAAGDAIAGGDLTTISTGSPISVEVVVQFNSVRFLNAISILDNKTLGMTTVTRRE
jgi:Flp pilus assembly protein TadG